MLSGRALAVPWVGNEGHEGGSSILVAIRQSSAIEGHAIGQAGGVWDEGVHSLGGQVAIAVSGGSSSPWVPGRVGMVVVL